MTDPTPSPRPQTLAAVRRSSLAAIGQRQLADGRTVPPQRAFKEEAKAIRAEIAALAVRTTSPQADGSAATRRERFDRVREARVSVERGDYGPVTILKGPHKGKLGYYDDDDLGSERRPGKAIVYLGEPFESDYIVIRHADLEKVTAKNIDLERWKRKYPWLARQLGLP